MSHEVYLSLELDHDRLGAVLGTEFEEGETGSFLEFLAGTAGTTRRAEAAELEAFLRQRQSHVLGRADRI